jgi:hypothetical protein
MVEGEECTDRVGNGFIQFGKKWSNKQYEVGIEPNLIDVTWRGFLHNFGKGERRRNP